MKINNLFLLHSFEYTVKKQGWMGGGTRSVKFAHAATSTPMVRSIIIFEIVNKDVNVVESN